MFYERACQEKTSPTASASAIFIGSLPLLRRELPPISLGAPAFLFLRAARGRCGPLAESGYFSFRSLPLGARAETSSLLRDGFLAEVIALQLANHGSIGGSRPTAISGHARGHTVRQGPQPKSAGTPSALILSLDLLHFRFQPLQAAARGSSETASHPVSRPPARSPSAHRTPLLSSTASRSPSQSFWPMSAEPALTASLSPSVGHNNFQTGLGESHPRRHS
jgi:hypothetical protein